MKKPNSKSSHIVRGLMDFLTEAGEKKLLPDVSDELQGMVAELKKTDLIEINSVVPLTADQKQVLTKSLRDLLQVNVPINFRLDKSLIGGFNIRLGDWFLDTSVKYQLNQMKNRLAD